jgi:putative AdoMet-dependent methyltransferase
MLNSEGFDLWADGYDESVHLSEEDGEYPFAGYKKVLGEIYRRVMERGGGDVLDVGFGTGVLTSRLYDSGCRIVGVDFSEKMIALAKAKMPEALLVQCDFSKGLPEEITRRRFSFIVSTYAFHHLRDGGKPGFLRRLSTLLKPGGEILVGDVSFETRRELTECKEKYREIWDGDEEYFVAEELEKALGGGLACDYRKISHCAGVLSVAVK